VTLVAADEVLGNVGSVWGTPTSLIPRSAFHVYDGLSHMQMKEKTVHNQFNIIVNHRF
jgi:hypothetical protein